MRAVIDEFSFTRDWPAVLEIWQNAGPGIQLRESDQPEEIQKKLLRDPDLFLTARLDGRIVGAVMGGYDGRRGFIYHLAVSEVSRKKGVASMLMEEVEKRLKRKGCVKVNLMVADGNQAAESFYENLGYERMAVTPYGKKLI